jgi:XTP/dITP diphosphohydrolase
MAPRTWILATRNTHKVEELQALLQGRVHLRSLNDFDLGELPETGRTLPENSAQKARYVYEHTGLPCLADDSGLEVEALNGEPGVDSAHYSGKRDDAANLALVLQKLEGYNTRKARFRCVLTLIEDNQTHVFDGTCEGELGLAPSGQGGFGYDPAFIPTGHTRTFAQMTSEEKNAQSHRAKAVAQLLAWLRENSSTFNP